MKKNAAAAAGAAAAVFRFYCCDGSLPEIESVPTLSGNLYK